MSEERDKLETRRARYLRDPLPVRLGNLASNLARLQSFARHPAMSEAAGRVIAESLLFIEWTQAEAEWQDELRALQQQLAQWATEWPALQLDAAQRDLVAAAAADWSQKILERSGLLAPEQR
jgi:hypothetical protein